MAKSLAALARFHMRQAFETGGVRDVRYRVVVKLPKAVGVPVTELLG